MDESILKLLDFLTVAEFAQAVLLIFILSVMDKNKKANIFFSAFLLILSGNFFAFYLFKSGMNRLLYIFVPLTLSGISVAGVLIYLYGLFMTGILEKFSFRCLYHFIIYFVGIAFFAFTSCNTEGSLFESPSFRKALFISMSIGLINSISYTVYTIVILKRYYNRIENYYSDIERVSLRWVIKLASLSFIALAFWCMGFWLAHFGVIPRSPAGMAVNVIIVIVIIFITAYHLINQPEIFKQNLEMNQEIDDESGIKIGAEKYAKQSIDETMQDEYMERLNSFMDGNKPYLNENLTIKELADSLGIPSHHLSIVINNRLNRNFYTFINEYRIRESLEILKDPDNCDASILSIAFKSGFNSKSTFNSTFKKITGVTPSEYRESMVFKSGLAS